MWYLYEKYRRVVKHNQHFWIAFIGQKGGEGKSTLAKQVLHFLDPSMDSKRVSMNYDDFIKSIFRAKSIQRLKFPSVLLDEPENKTHAMSAKARKFRDILEKIRQMNLFVGVCANSWTSVPTFIQERLTAVCYLTQKHRFALWDKDKDPEHAIIEDIKENWGKQRHKVFMNPAVVNRAMFLNLRFSSKCPFDDSEYLKKKEDDLLRDISSYIEDTQPKPKPNKNKKGDKVRDDESGVKDFADSVSKRKMEMFKMPSEK
jgi:hypothetical protein